MIDSDLVRRIRDQLLANGRPSLVPSADFDLDGLAPFETASLERIAPLAELLFLMMSADGRFEDAEVDTIRGAVRTLTDGLLRGSTADKLVERFRAALAADGLDERLTVVTGLIAADREDAEVGVMLAASVALADGSVGDEERSLFDEVIASLGIGRKRLDELLGRG